MSNLSIMVNSQGSMGEVTEIPISCHGDDVVFTLLILLLDRPGRAGERALSKNLLACNRRWNNTDRVSSRT